MKGPPLRNAIPVSGWRTGFLLVVATSNLEEDKLAGYMLRGPGPEVVRAIGLYWSLSETA
jgi:hypothetical protein